MLTLKYHYSIKEIQPYLDRLNKVSTQTELSNVEIIYQTEYHDPRSSREQKNYKRCLELIAEAGRDDDRISEFFIKDIHSFLSNGIYTLHLEPGKYRKFPAMVCMMRGKWGSPYYPAEKTYQDVCRSMMRFCKTANAMSDVPHSIKAGLCHISLLRIHPFADFNGRVARLLEMALLKAYGYRFNPYVMSNYFYQNCKDYYIACNKAHNSGNATDFLKVTHESLLYAMSYTKH